VQLVVVSLAAATHECVEHHNTGLSLEHTLVEAFRRSRSNGEFVDQLGSNCGSVADIEVVPAGGFIRGGLRKIHTPDAIALVRPVEETVSDCQGVAFADLSIYPPKK